MESVLCTILSLYSVCIFGTSTILSAPLQANIESAINAINRYIIHFLILCLLAEIPVSLPLPSYL